MVVSRGMTRVLAGSPAGCSFFLLESASLALSCVESSSVIWAVHKGQGCHQPAQVTRSVPSSVLILSVSRVGVDSSLNEVHNLIATGTSHSTFQPVRG